MPTGRVGRGRFGAAVLFVALDAALDFANVVEVLAEPRAIAGAEPAPQRVGFLGDHVEDAEIPLALRAALLGRARLAEQPFEHHARVDLHRQRRRRRAPADRVRVDAAEADRARADIAREVLRGQLQRRKRRVLADLLGDHLIDRGVGADVLRFGAFGVHAGQPSGRADGVIAGRRAGAGEIADHDQRIAESLERFEARRKIEVDAAPWPDSTAP